MGTTTPTYPLEPKTRKNTRKISKGAAGRNWCYAHKTVFHSDVDCYYQGAPRPPQSVGACIASAVLIADSPPDADEKKLSLNFDEMSMRDSRAQDWWLAEEILHFNADSFKMIVDSRASYPEGRG